MPHLHLALRATVIGAHPSAAMITVIAPASNLEVVIPTKSPESAQELEDAAPPALPLLQRHARQYRRDHRRLRRL